MKQFALRLWRDEAGFVVSTELVLIATILVIGLITGLVTVRDAVAEEIELLTVTDLESLTAEPTGP